MIWGGRAIARFLGKNLTTPQSYGESWEVSDHALHQSRLATASGFGVTLRRLMTSHRDDLLGPAGSRYSAFPWLIKWLDARDWLSVQVHPDGDVVERLLPGEAAKTEAWLVVDAQPESRIYAGLMPGVGPRELRDALARGDVTTCLHSFHPTSGDIVFLPAGTVHAVGGGVLMAEIQQTSDATFRLFDWNRVDAQGKPRPLHVEEAFASIHWDAGPVAPIALADHREPLISCPYFAIERFRADAPMQVGGRGQLQAWIVAAGHGRFDNGECFLPGDAWILPAALAAMTIHPDRPVAGMLCTLPS